MLVCPEGRTQGQPELLQSSSNIYVPCQRVTERARSAMLGTAWSTASSTTGLSWVVGYAAEGVVRTF